MVDETNKSFARFSQKSEKSERYKEEKERKEGSERTKPTTLSPAEMEARTRHNNLVKLNSVVANKDIYEFSDTEKELYIEHNPEQFSHAEDDVEDTCEFISSSPVAEAVLSDFFTKKERTKGMDFLFNFHTKQ